MANIVGTRDLIIMYMEDLAYLNRNRGQPEMGADVDIVVLVAFKLYVTSFCYLSKFNFLLRVVICSPTETNRY